MLHSATSEYMRPSREYHTCSGAMASINAASTATRLPATAQPSPSIAPTAAMPAMAETQRPCRSEGPRRSSAFRISPKSGGCGSSAVSSTGTGQRAASTL